MVMGRPRLKEGKDSDRISFRVTVEEKEKFHKKVQEKGTRPSTVLRKYVQRFSSSKITAKTKQS